MLDMTDRKYRVSLNERFGKVLAATSDESSCEPFDVALHRNDEIVLCPTLGSFLPFWYLMIPTEHHLNFADWQRADGQRSVSELVQETLLDVFGQTDNLLWFEHGAVAKGSITGCGVDHAHIHILLTDRFTTDDILQAAVSLGVEVWTTSETKDVYQNLTDGEEYLVFGDLSVSHVKTLSTPVGTQFFRRALALLDGCRTDWDYKDFAHDGNARQSLEHVLTSKKSALASHQIGS